MAQLNVRIRDESKQALKIKAIQQGITLQDLLEKILQNYLENKQE